MEFFSPPSPNFRLLGRLRSEAGIFIPQLQLVRSGAPVDCPTLGSIENEPGAAEFTIQGSSATQCRASQASFFLRRQCEVRALRVTKLRFPSSRSTPGKGCFCRLRGQPRSPPRDRVSSGRARHNMREPLSSRLPCLSFPQQARGEPRLLRQVGVVIEVAVGPAGMYSSVASCIPVPANLGACVCFDAVRPRRSGRAAPGRSNSWAFCFLGGQGGNHPYV